MFCPNCGVKNKDDAKFCEECGTRLEATENQVSQVSVVREKRTWKKAHIIIGVEALVMVALLIGFFQYGKKVNSAETVAKNFFVYTMNGDWDSVYDYLDCSEDIFLTKELFVSAMKDEEVDEYSNFSVKVEEEDKDKIGTTVEVSYRSSDSSGDSTMDVELNKQSTKEFLFFDEWKVNAADYIKQDFTISVLKGAKVSFDGIELGSNYLDAEQDSSSVDCYTIPKVFKGTHTITVTKEGRKTVTQELNRSEGSYSLSSMELEEELKQELVKQAGDAMKQIFEAAIAGKEFTEIKGLFGTDAEQLSAIEANYNSLMEGIKYVKGESGVSKLSFTDIEGECDSYDSYYSSGDGQVYVDLSYTYEKTYLRKWYFDEKAEVYTDNRSETSKRFTFSNENDKWVISSIPYFWM